MKSSLFYLAKNRNFIKSLYSNITNPTIINERLDLLSKYWSIPRQFIKMANI